MPKKKVMTFEQAVKKNLGKNYLKLSKEDRQTVKEMSECQEEGGPVGSAPMPDYFLVND